MQSRLQSQLRNESIYRQKSCNISKIEQKLPTVSVLKEKRQNNFRKQLLKELLVLGIFKHFQKKFKQEEQKLIHEKQKEIQVIDKAEKNIFLQSNMKKRFLNNKLIQKQYYTVIDPISNKIKDFRQNYENITQLINIICRQGLITRSPAKKQRKSIITNSIIKLQRNMSILKRSNMQFLPSNQLNKNVNEYNNDQSSIQNEESQNKNKKTADVLNNNHLKDGNDIYIFQSINRDLNYITRKNPDYQIIAIRNIISSTLQKSSLVKIDLLTSYNSLAKLKSNQFINIYYCLNNINQYISNINKILLKHIKIEKRLTRKSKVRINNINDINGNSQAIILNNLESSSLEQKKNSMKNISQIFKKNYAKLLENSEKYLSSKQNRTNMSNKQYKNLIQCFMKARYNLGYLHKQIQFLSTNITINQKNYRNIQKSQSLYTNLEKNQTKSNSRFANMTKALREKYNMEYEFNQKFFQKCQSLSFLHKDSHPIADHREYIKQKMYKNPFNRQSISLMKKYKNANYQIHNQIR